MKPLALLLLTLATMAHAEVTVTRQGEGWQLRREGQPYFIKGGGGSTHLEALAKAGGNSVRLWGTAELGETLETAQKLGLTVTAGLWLGQVRQGFKWSDPKSLERQREQVRQAVEKYRGHPALLCWALGNEMEDPAGKNLAVWTELNTLALLVKELDPHHPVMTVIAEIGGEKIANFEKLCPAFDLLGINSYGGAPSLPARYRKAGGTRPYLLTEYGPAGIWETARGPLGAFPEPTSTAKAETYRRAYAGAVTAAPGLCLGSYAFVWGQKQEVTATWFSLFLPDGSHLAAVDTLTALWGGRPPAARCPEITALAFDGPATGTAGTALRAKLTVKGETLAAEWQLRREPIKFASGGDKEAVPAPIPEAIAHGDLTGVEVKLPAEPGLYRLFVTVRDRRGGAAVGNLVLRSENP